MKGPAKGTTETGCSGPAAELKHELGNVLNGLLGMTRLLCESGCNPHQALWLKAIDQSAHQLQRLLHRIEAGPGGSIEPQVADLDGIDLLEQVALRHALAARNHDNQLLLTVHPGLPRTWHGDPGLLQQVLDNLLGNAIKYTRGGEVRVIAQPLGGSGSLVVEVHDTGPGIKPGCEGRIFAAGQRGEPGVSDGAAGYGLGLYLCRRIVTAMDGEIICLSPSSGGAIFRVQLPGMLTAAGARRSARTPRLLRALLCVLDLDDPLRNCVAAWLERLGVPWCVVGSIEAAESSPSLRICIRRLREAGYSPGPHLRLDAHSGKFPHRESARVKGPIIGSSLCPALLDLALRDRRFRRGKRD